MAEPLDRASLLADRTLSGTALCRAYSARVDEWIAGLLDEAGRPPGVALVAVGGYGRSELSPASDIDLLLLHGGQAGVAELADRIWYPIWDAGLKLGHAVRTIKETVSLAADDLETATALLSCRHVAGDGALTSDLHARALGLWQKRSKRFLAELSTTVRDRHERAGEVAFLLEPDLKEGRGGLRDVHAIRWAEAAHDVLVEGDDARLADAYERILSARVELHRATGRAGDRLALQEQEAVATALGFPDAAVLMRDLSRAARDIAWTSDDTWRRVDSSLSGPLSIRIARDKVLAPGVVLREGLVHLALDADPLADPHLVLEVAAQAAERAAWIDRPSLDRLAAAASSATAAGVAFPWTPTARATLARLLLAGLPAIDVVEALDRRGVWVWLLPEWEGVRCKPQRNAYHTYTVDRHLCVAAANAAAVASMVERPDLLVVGTLLHDIGKGYPGDHTEVGIDLLAVIGPRMGFDAEEVAILQQMVRHHLLLPDVATRRDLDDDATIERVAGAVGSLEVLHLLHALTIADSTATGPAAWNDWKAGLVAELARRTEHLLGGGRPADVATESFPTEEQLALLADRQVVVRGADNQLTVAAPDRPGLFSRVAGTLSLHGLDVLGAAAHTSDDGMALEVFTVESSSSPAVAWPKVVADVEAVLGGRLALSARLAERAERYARVSSSPSPLRREPSVLVDNEASASSTVVEVHCPDAIGILYRITRAIAELDLDIRSAKVQTLGQEVVDAFYLRGADGAKLTDPGLLKELERAILRAVRDTA